MTSFNRCVYHPNNETNLSCGKCGNPICFRCVVQTPVGIRCKKCANLQRVPTFDVPTPVLLKAILIGVGMAVLTGFAWSFLRFVGVGLIIIVGYLIGEVISLAVNRKRGKSLQYVAGASTILSFFISTLYANLMQIGEALFAGLIGVGYAATLVLVAMQNVILSLLHFPFGIFSIVTLVLGVYLSIYKFR